MKQPSQMALPAYSPLNNTGKLRKPSSPYTGQRTPSIAPVDPNQALATAKIDKLLKLSVAAQKCVIDYTSKVLGKSKDFIALKNKMDAIDIAYARYTATRELANADGKDPLPTPDASVACDVFTNDNVVPPIVVSQVDSYVAYLSEVFLSGSPIFPVVSSPSTRLQAEQLEAILDTHSSLGGYTRQLLMFIRDAAKYNFAAIETDWDAISQFSVLDDVANPRGKATKRADKYFTKLQRLNPRNVIWDMSVNPGDVAEHGDYAGYVTRMTRTKLKRLLNKWTAQGKVYNPDKALQAVSSATASYTPNYTEDPQISEYVPTGYNTLRTGVDWEAYFDGNTGRKGSPGPTVTGSIYEIFTLYARVMPADFGITAPAPNTPQIWKFVTVNNQIMVYAERIISAYDFLPILFGQPLEDGLGYQTQSIAEGEVPFQKAASTLFNIRFAAARRAVSDRALYLPDMIKPSDINSKAPAPKIPVSISQLSPKKIGDAYAQIPFDMRGTETTIQDASTIVQFSRDLHGVNGPRQGQFQKGNKSVSEWNDTMGGSDGRMRLPALTLECQVFSPLKSILALNIFQYGDDGVVTSQLSGEQLAYKIDELRSAALTFKMADGYTPKSKIASTDMLAAGMQLIGNSPILQQAFGNRLPGMFIHFLSLSGLKGFDEYDPARAQQAPGQLGAAANALTTPPQESPVATGAVAATPGLPGGSQLTMQTPGSAPIPGNSTPAP